MITCVAANSGADWIQDPELRDLAGDIIRRIIIYFCKLIGEPHGYCGEAKQDANKLCFDFGGQDGMAYRMYEDTIIGKLGWYDKGTYVGRGFRIHCKNVAAQGSTEEPCTLAVFGWPGVGQTFHHSRHQERLSYAVVPEWPVPTLKDRQS